MHSCRDERTRPAAVGVPVSEDPFEVADRAAEAQERAARLLNGPVRNTTRLAMGTMKTARAMMTTSVVRGRWHAVTGVLWLLLAIAMWVAFVTNESWSFGTFTLALLSFHSFGFILGLPFLLAVPGRVGRALSVLVYPIIFVAMVWRIAQPKP